MLRKGVPAGTRCALAGPAARRARSGSGCARVSAAAETAWSSLAHHSLPRHSPHGVPVHTTSSGTWCTFGHHVTQRIVYWCSRRHAPHRVPVVATSSTATRPVLSTSYTEWQHVTSCTRGCNAVDSIEPCRMLSPPRPMMRPTFLCGMHSVRPRTLSSNSQMIPSFRRIDAEGMEEEADVYRQTVSGQSDTFHAHE